MSEIDYIYFFGLKCACIKSQTEAESIISRLVNEQYSQNHIVTTVALNAEKIIKSEESEELKEIINKKSLPFADGVGALLAAKFLTRTRLVKIDMPNTVLKVAQESGFRVFLLGTTAENNKLAADNIKLNYPGISIVGRHDGFFSDMNAVVSLLHKTKPQIILIAMGSPRQELLASSLYYSYNNALFVGCGGALDIMAGKKIRAPKWTQKMHIEWLYRLISEPRRIKRQMALPMFMIRLLKESFNIRVLKKGILDAESRNKY